VWLLFRVDRITGPQTAFFPFFRLGHVFRVGHVLCGGVPLLWGGCWGVGCVWCGGGVVGCCLSFA
jgi:hypothetical protein